VERLKGYVDSGRIEQATAMAEAVEEAAPRRPAVASVRRAG
jgi:hypothetical protein